MLFCIIVSSGQFLTIIESEDFLEYSTDDIQTFTTQIVSSDQSFYQIISHDKCNESVVASGIDIINKTISWCCTSCNYCTPDFPNYFEWYTMRSACEQKCGFLYNHGHIIKILPKMKIEEKGNVYTKNIKSRTLFVKSVNNIYPISLESLIMFDDDGHLYKIDEFGRLSSFSKNYFEQIKITDELLVALVNSAVNITSSIVKMDDFNFNIKPV